MQFEGKQYIIEIRIVINKVMTQNNLHSFGFCEVIKLEKNPENNIWKKLG